MPNSVECKKVFRTCNWCDAETHLLLDIWGDRDIQLELRYSAKIQPIFDRIAVLLTANGYERSGVQCREKIKTLKRELRYAKMAGRSRSNFRFWDRMESVMQWQPQLEAYKHVTQDGTPMLMMMPPQQQHMPHSMIGPTTSSNSDAVVFKQEIIDLVSDVDVVVVEDGLDFPELEGNGGVRSVGTSQGCEFAGAAVMTAPSVNPDARQPRYPFRRAALKRQRSVSPPPPPPPPPPVTQMHQQQHHLHHQLQQQQQQQQQLQHQQLNVGYDVGRLENIIESAVGRVTAVLCETQSRLLEFEEKRIRFELEREEIRRKESRAHEIELLNSVGQMFLQAIQLLHGSKNSSDGGGSSFCGCGGIRGNFAAAADTSSSSQR